MNPARAHSIDELRVLARKKLPRVAFDFVDGGAEENLTLRLNREALDAVQFAPRVCAGERRGTQKVTIFGHRYDGPYGIAPLGAAGLYWRDAEIALARAARRANLPFALSTHSFASVDRVARESGRAPWFQLYTHRERAGTEEAVRRAAAAGCEVLIYTSDVPVGGNREQNHRNGFSVPLRLGFRTLGDALRHPSQFAAVYLRGMRRGALVEWGTPHDADTWEDFAWLRRIWPRKLVLKGVLTMEDAQLAVHHGADGIIVSNHGGRQLDGAPATLEVLPQIAAVVGAAVTVMVDGGFRRGADIVKALALGADMVLVGRAALYGAAAGGEAGALRALEILKSEIDEVLDLLGCGSLAELGPQYLQLR